MYVKEIASKMYVDGGEHMKMMGFLGKDLDIATIQRKRYYLVIIIADFGDMEFERILLKDILDCVMKKHKSKCWCNLYIEMFKEVYQQYLWEIGSPVMNLTFPRFVYRPEPKSVLTVDDINKIFFGEDIWAEESARMIALVLLFCGLRKGEAIGIRLKQIDFVKRMLTIDGFVKNNGERTNYNKCGRNVVGGKTRCVVIPDILLRELQYFLKDKKIGEEDFIFTKKKGGIFQTTGYNYIFNKAIQESGINMEGRHITPHSLRYTYITRMRQYTDIDTVRIMAGHNDKKMTDYYTICETPEMLLTFDKAFTASNKILNI